MMNTKLTYLFTLIFLLSCHLKKSRTIIEEEEFELSTVKLPIIIDALSHQEIQREIGDGEYQSISIEKLHSDYNLRGSSMIKIRDSSLLRGIYKIRVDSIKNHLICVNLATESHYFYILVDKISSAITDWVDVGLVWQDSIGLDNYSSSSIIGNEEVFKYSRNSAFKFLENPTEVYKYDSIDQLLYNSDTLDYLETHKIARVNFRSIVEGLLQKDLNPYRCYFDNAFFNNSEMLTMTSKYPATCLQSMGSGSIDSSGSVLIREYLLEDDNILSVQLNQKFINRKFIKEVQLHIQNKNGNTIGSYCVAKKITEDKKLIKLEIGSIELKNNILLVTGTKRRVYILNNGL